MPTGTVKWFDTTKGYGFIAPDGGNGPGGGNVPAAGGGPAAAGKDVFVHISAVERSGLTGLADGQRIGFELTEGRDGRSMATDLRSI